MEIKKYIEGVAKTGFPFEAETVFLLGKAGWIIISNRYYIDSDRDEPREMDIIAYKAGGGDIQVVTALIISCKKSEHANWSFLSRDENRANPNFIRERMHFWSDSSAMRHLLESKNWIEDYYSKTAEMGVVEVVREVDYHVFALQEMANGNKKNEPEGVPKGDAAMFGSVMSLMKAQFHELQVREKKKRDDPRVYQFNLVSLVDTDLVRIHFTQDEITATEVDLVHYTGSYIFNDDYDSSNIVFCKKEAFPRILDDFGRLHEANKAIVHGCIKDFYSSVLTSRPKIVALLLDFRSKFEDSSWMLQFDWPEFNVDMLHVSPKKIGDDLQITVMSLNEDMIKYMNENERVKSAAAAALKAIYKYEGGFFFK
ncbi:hypothetical protein [Burkholderia sp. YIM B11467]